MSDYTPTTGEIRDHWRSAWSPRNPEAADASFDGWLAGVIAEKRAEWEAEQGETEWEWSGDSIAFPGTSLMRVYAVRANAELYMQPGYRLVCRRKAGPWMPVEGEAG